MKSKIFALVISLVLLLVWAYPAAAGDEGNPGKVVRPVKPGVLEVVFIHYEKPDNPAGKSPPPAPEEKVYDYYQLIGPKWDLTKYPGGIPFTVNPRGAPAGAENEVTAGLVAWDNATGATLFGTFTTATDKWWGQLDGRNNVSWQLIAGAPNAIAGTWIWVADNDESGTLSPGDETLETDIVFNTLKKIPWGIDADGEGTTYKISAYDVRNIATHEAGHVVGLDDLYESKYSELTMYGYGAKGETKKISLEIGDKNGTVALYGS